MQVTAKSSFDDDKSVLLPTGHSNNLAQSRDIDLLLRSDWQIFYAESSAKRSKLDSQPYL